LAKKDEEKYQLDMQKTRKNGTDDQNSSTESERKSVPGGTFVILAAVAIFSSFLVSAFVISSSDSQEYFRGIVASFCGCVILFFAMAFPFTCSMALQKMRIIE
jgi:hypothetical protein